MDCLLENIIEQTTHVNEGDFALGLGGNLHKGRLCILLAMFLAVRKSLILRGPISVFQLLLHLLFFITILLYYLIT